jgi:hypothetical protein
VPTSRTPGRPSSAQRAVAHEHELALAEPLDCPCQAEHVLALDQRADAEEPHAPRMPADFRPCLLRVTQREPVEVDAAVDHRRLRPGLRHGLDEPVAEPGRHRHDRVGAADGVPGRRAHGSTAARVLDVLAVRRDDEGRAPADGGEQSRRDEEVGVDDVGTEAAAGPQHVERQMGMPASAARPVDHRPRELVPSLLERLFERGDEGPERRRTGARVHLGDEEDPHARTPSGCASARAHRAS